MLQMKETLHLGRHSTEQHKDQGAARQQTTATSQPPPAGGGTAVHTTQSEGNVHIMRRGMTGGTASEPGAGLGTQDAAGRVPHLCMQRQ